MKKPLDPVQTKRSGNRRIEQVGLGITSADAANVRMTQSRAVDVKVFRCITVAAERDLIKTRPISSYQRLALEFLRQLQASYPELYLNPDEMTDEHIT